MIVFYSILVNLSALSVLVPIIIAIKNFKAFDSKLKALTLYLFGCFVFDFLGMLLVRFKINNTSIFDSFSLFEFIVIAYFYLSNIYVASNYLKFPKQVVFSILILFGSAGFAVAKITNSIEIFNLIAKGLLISCASVILIKGINNTETENHDNIFNRLSGAFLIYFSTSFLLFIGDSFVSSAQTSIAQFLWIIHLLNSMVLYLSIAYYLWKNKTT